MYYGQRKYIFQNLEPAKNIADSIIYSFQIRNTAALMTIILGSFVLIFGPALYFIRSNYDNFIRLAYDLNPMIVQNLERESFWITSYILLGTVIFLSVVFYMSFKMTKKIASPLMDLDSHMRLMMKGNLSIDPIRYQNHEDFQQVLITYTNLQTYLVQQNRLEVDLLKKLVLSDHHRESHSAYQDLLSLKENESDISKKLNSPLPTTDAVPAENTHTPSKKKSQVA